MGGMNTAARRERSRILPFSTTAVTPFPPPPASLSADRATVGNKQVNNEDRSGLHFPNNLGWGGGAGVVEGYASLFLFISDQISAQPQIRLEGWGYSGIYLG